MFFKLFTDNFKGAKLIKYSILWSYSFTLSWTSMKRSVFYLLFVFSLLACDPDDDLGVCIIAEETWGRYDSDSTVMLGLSTFPQNYLEVFSQNVDPLPNYPAFCGFFIMDSFQVDYGVAPYLGGQYRYVFDEEDMDTFYFNPVTSNNGMAKFHPATGYLELEGKGVFYRRN